MPLQTNVSEKRSLYNANDIVCAGYFSHLLASCSKGYGTYTQKRSFKGIFHLLVTNFFFVCNVSLVKTIENS